MSTAWLSLVAVLFGAAISLAGQWLLYRSQAEMRSRELAAERRERQRVRLMPYILVVAQAGIAMDRALLVLSDQTESELAAACEPLLPILPMLNVEPELRPIGESLTELRLQIESSYDDLQRAWQNLSDPHAEAYRMAVRLKLQALRTTLQDVAARLSA